MKSIQMKEPHIGGCGAQRSLLSRHRSGHGSVTASVLIKSGL